LKLAALFAYGASELILTRPATREQRAEWLHRFCLRSLLAMGIATRIQGEFPDRGVVISNHTGYLDIVVFAALHRCVFVSKAEIARWPFLGWMTTMAGTLYVQRGRSGSATRAKCGMQAVADAGLPIVFFPEGTTSDGTSVLSFHSGLLSDAIEEDQPVTAAYVRYRLTRDNGPGITVPSHVAFWGDTPILPHIFRMLALRGIEAEVHIADLPIAFSNPSDRKLAAAEARTAVTQLGEVRDPVPAG
jgi:1-acyl-sn-glycerol-3-phosphate acyltransferase